MVINPQDLAKIRSQNSTKKIVLTSGTFDLLHIGHLSYLENVKKYGDIVVVLLSGDKRVRGRKGPTRPVIDENDRAQMLGALRVVDYVLIDPVDFKDESGNLFYKTLVNNLQPDLYVTDGEDPRFLGILDKSKQVILPRTCSCQECSTTDIIKRIKEF
jgi:D-glycero-beta-D-manno-heptose 1-phosphate adenylyltransferase